MVQAKYQYETSPRKVDTDYKRARKSTTKNRGLKLLENKPGQQLKKSKEQRKKETKMTITVIGIVLLLLTISCRNSQIDKKFNQIQEHKRNLALLQKENEQLKVSIENSLNLNNVEKVAKDELGMQKLTNKQIIYINLPKKDYIESASEKIIIEQEEKNWIEKIIDKVLNI